MIRTHSSARRLFALSALAFAATLASAPASADWNWGRTEQVQGNGNIKRQARNVEHFTGVGAGVSGQVEVRTGNSEGVTIETDENLLPLIETVVEDGTLQIRGKRNTNLRTRTMKIIVQTRGIERLSLGGSGSVDADRVAGKRVQLDLGGSGSLVVRKAEGNEIGVNLGGSGNLKVDEGSARSLSASIGGSGNIDMPRVRVDTASVSIAGSGEATLWVTNSLDLTVAGSGDVNYYGDPKVSKTAIGSGSTRRLGPSPR